jgi:hypothetical protein
MGITPEELSGVALFEPRALLPAFLVTPKDGTVARPTNVEYTLVIPTKDRSYHLTRRIPVWKKQGLDAIIVVDSSLDPAHRKANEELCKRHGARYLYATVNRSRARNLGAAVAGGSWVFFADDDLWGYAIFHREVMDRYALEYDWLKAADSQVIHIFRRDFFLRLGGYRENLVLGEDEDLAVRARAQGKGGPIEGLFEGIGFEPDRVERAMDFPRRLSNYMEYSYTLWEYLERAENPPQVALSWFVTVLRLLRSMLQGEIRALCYFLGAVGGLFFGLVAKPLRQARLESRPVLGGVGGR